MFKVEVIFLFQIASTQLIIKDYVENHFMLSMTAKTEMMSVDKRWSFRDWLSWHSSSQVWSRACLCHTRKYLLCLNIMVFRSVIDLNCQLINLLISFWYDFIQVSVEYVENKTKWPSEEVLGDRSQRHLQCHPDGSRRHMCYHNGGDGRHQSHLQCYRSTKHQTNGDMIRWGKTLYLMKYNENYIWKILLI